MRHPLPPRITSALDAGSGSPHARRGATMWAAWLRRRRNGRTTTFTNRANGKTVTVDSSVVNKDLRVTDNGDGTLTILALATGNDVFYGPDGRAIGRSPGQIRFEILVDHGGTPTDRFDDVELDFRLVRESTGRSDDFAKSQCPH